MIDIANYFHKNCSTNNSLEIFPSRKVIINYVYRNLELYKENQREPDGKTASLKVIKKASGPGGPAGWQPVTNMLHVIRLLLLLFFLFLFFFFFHFLFSSTVRYRFVWGPTKARLVCPVQIFPPVYLCSGIGGSSARSAIWRTAGISTSFLLSEREREEDCLGKQIVATTGWTTKWRIFRRRKIYESGCSIISPFAASINSSHPTTFVYYNLSLLCKHLHINPFTLSHLNGVFVFLFQVVAHLGESRHRPPARLQLARSCGNQSRELVSSML